MLHPLNVTGATQNRFKQKVPAKQKKLLRTHYKLNSHESAVVVMSDLDGGRKVMSLHRGLCGLRSDIPQAEGITSDDRDTLWIVSEPNLFYRFTRTAAS
ncbi:SdiA-regulated domain-containing protein [Salmonella enterica]|uniref:SdiA-regulated domain-containing protein n=1 Tax=Salmonella enterica TaxID=28901 RepID=UPI0024AF2334|nr:SdiA-regulated domain-containing protein [Salmonella enterica]